MTDKFVREAPCPQSGSLTFWDTKLHGFGLRCLASGRKSFVVRYQSDCQERQLTIGPYPTLGVSVARTRASEVRSAAHLGRDVLQERKERRRAKEATLAAPTLGLLRAMYFEQHVERRRTPKGQKNERKYWTDIEAFLGVSTKLASLTREDVAELHHKLSAKAPVSANRAIVSLKTAFNQAVRAGLVSSNPCVGLALNPEAGRERYLTDAEFQRLADALRALPSTVCADAIRVLLLTGARRGELAKARRQEFDLVAGIWRKPATNTKQRRSHTIPLSEEAVIILRRMIDTPNDDGKVLPGSSTLWEDRLSRGWAAARKSAGLEGARLHDLRHSYASVLADGGHSLLMIASLLGHSSTVTTQRYAHLGEHGRRAATEGVSRRIAASSVMTYADAQYGSTTSNFAVSEDS